MCGEWNVMMPERRFASGARALILAEEGGELGA
jgi:hypothetical protein